MMAFFKRRPEPLSEEEKERKVEQATEFIASEEESESISPIFKSVFIQFCVAALVLLLCVTATFAFRQIGFLVGLMFSAYLVYNALALWFDNKNGNIYQKVLLCMSVKPNLSGVKIVMQDVTVKPAKFYEFYYARNGCPFIPEQVYILYLNKKEPHRIVSWLEV